MNPGCTNIDRNCAPVEQWAEAVAFKTLEEDGFSPLEHKTYFTKTVFLRKFQIISALSAWKPRLSLRHDSRLQTFFHYAGKGCPYLPLWQHSAAILHNLLIEHIPKGLNTPVDIKKVISSAKRPVDVISPPSDILPESNDQDDDVLLDKLVQPHVTDILKALSAASKLTVYVPIKPWIESIANIIAPIIKKSPVELFYYLDKKITNLFECIDTINLYDWSMLPLEVRNFFNEIRPCLRCKISTNRFNPDVTCNIVQEIKPSDSMEFLFYILKGWSHIPKMLPELTSSNGSKKRRI